MVILEHPTGLCGGCNLKLYEKVTYTRTMIDHVFDEQKHEYIRDEQTISFTVITCPRPYCPLYKIRIKPPELYRILLPNTPYSIDTILTFYAKVKGNPNIKKVAREMKIPRTTAYSHIERAQLLL